MMQPIVLIECEHTGHENTGYFLAAVILDGPKDSFHETLLVAELLIREDVGRVEELVGDCIVFVNQEVDLMTKKPGLLADTEYKHNV
jgi:hypothetical protein